MPTHARPLATVGPTQSPHSPPLSFRAQPRNLRPPLENRHMYKTPRPLAVNPLRLCRHAVTLFASRPSISAPPPYLKPTANCLALQSPRHLSPIYDRTTQTPDRDTIPTCTPRSKGHSIDAIPSCADFTASQFPNLRRDPPGVEEAEKRVRSIQCNANLPLMVSLSNHHPELVEGREWPTGPACALPSRGHLRYTECTLQA